MASATCRRLAASKRLELERRPRGDRRHPQEGRAARLALRPLAGRAARLRLADHAPSGLAPCKHRAPMAAIELSGVVKRFGPITAVDGLDLDVPEGICLGLLGPNGAGKSTTMRLLTGQAIADAGELRVLGHELPGESKAARAEMGVVPQLDNLDVDVTVEDNLAVYARLYRVKDVGAAVDRGARPGPPARPPPRRRRRALRRHAPAAAAGPRPRPRTEAGPARRADRRPRPADPDRALDPDRGAANRAARRS